MIIATQSPVKETVTERKVNLAHLFWQNQYNIVKFKNKIKLKNKKKK